MMNNEGAITSGPYGRWLRSLKRRIGHRAWKKLMRMRAPDATAYLKRRGFIYVNDGKGITRKLDTKAYRENARKAALTRGKGRVAS